MLKHMFRWCDFMLVVIVQGFMLLQVGFFYLLLRLRSPQRAKQASTCEIRTISVVVPAFNEAHSISRCLRTLASTRELQQPDEIEVIVCDAGCQDATVAIVAEMAPTLPFAIQITSSQGGRGPALNAGIRAAKGDVILVLHADTLLPAGWDVAVLHALRTPGVLMTAFRFGCDRNSLLQPSAPPAGLAVMEFTVNLRSTWYELPFGDQALALTARTLSAVGGYPDFCILEEYEL